MSVKVRPYRNGGWEVDIQFRLPDGTRHRERYRAPVESKSGALRWGQDRERHLLQHGPEPAKKEVPTLEEFAPKFLEGYAKADRHKPSGVASKETILRIHLIPVLGAQKLDAIIERPGAAVEAALEGQAAKTVNNVLTVLNVMLKTAVEWEHDRAASMFDPLAARCASGSGVPRLRCVRAAARSGAIDRLADLLDRLTGR